jgi:hypothetical protein
MICNAVMVYILFETRMILLAVKTQGQWVTSRYNSSLLYRRSNSTYGKGVPGDRVCVGRDAVSGFVLHTTKETANHGATLAQ